MQRVGAPGGPPQDPFAFLGVLLDGGEASRASPQLQGSRSSGSHEFYSYPGSGGDLSFPPPGCEYSDSASFGTFYTTPGTRSDDGQQSSASPFDSWNRLLPQIPVSPRPLYEVAAGGEYSPQAQSNFLSRISQLGTYSYIFTTFLTDEQEINLLSEGCSVCGLIIRKQSYFIVSCLSRGCSHVVHSSCAQGECLVGTLSSHAPLVRTTRGHFLSRRPLYSSFQQQPIAQPPDQKFVLEFSLMSPITDCTHIFFSSVVASSTILETSLDRVVLQPRQLYFLPPVPFTRFRFRLSLNYRVNPKLTYFSGEWFLEIDPMEPRNHFVLGIELMNTVTISISTENGISTLSEISLDFLTVPSQMLQQTGSPGGLPQIGSVLQSLGGLSASLPAPLTPISLDLDQQRLGFNSNPSPGTTSGMTQSDYSPPHSSRSRGGSQRNSGSVPPVPQGKFQAFQSQILELSSSQIGSKALQDMIPSLSIREWEDLVQEIIPHLETIIENQFGNYFLQKVLKYCPENLVCDILSAMCPAIPRISCNKTGTYALQNIIDSIISEKHCPIIAAGLQNDLLNILTHQLAIHVVNKFMCRFPPTQFQFVIDFIGTHFREVALNQFGITILRTILQKGLPEQQQVVVENVVEYSYELSRSEYGNYAVQYTIDHSPQSACKVYEKVKPKLVELSQNKYGSNVIEKCITVSPPTRHEITQALLLHKPFSALLQDRFSGFVIQTAMTDASPEDRELLVQCIRTALKSLPRDGKATKWSKILDAYTPASMS